jgi:hypothetical protein
MSLLAIAAGRFVSFRVPIPQNLFDSGYLRKADSLAELAS